MTLDPLGLLRRSALGLLVAFQVSLLAGVTVFQACTPTTVPGPAPPAVVTVGEPRVVLSDVGCRVVTLVHAGGVEESLCLTASDVQRAYDWHAKRDAGCAR